jgi:hypothetical protein
MQSPEPGKPGAAQQTPGSWSEDGAQEVPFAGNVLEAP